MSVKFSSTFAPRGIALFASHLARSGTFSPTGIWPGGITAVSLPEVAPDGIGGVGSVARILHFPSCPRDPTVVIEFWRAGARPVFETSTQTPTEPSGLT